MSKVKRFEAFTSFDDFKSRMVESKEGNYVSYSDYLSLAAENSSLRLTIDNIVKALGLGDGQVSQQVIELVTGLVAENVALKSGVTYFAASPDYGWDIFKNKEDAIATCQEEIDSYRECRDDGWDDEVGRVCWGIVIQKAEGFDDQGLHTSNSQHTYQTCDYRLEDEIKTPTTDAAIAELKAQGVDEFVIYATAPRFTEHELTVEDAEEFAANLRSGGKAS